MLDASTIDWPLFGLGVAIGFLLGIGIAFAVKAMRTKTARTLAEEIYRENEILRREGQETLLARVEKVFGDLSLEALRRTGDAFLKLAATRLAEERTLSSRELETKKVLIDAQLDHMGMELEKLAQLVRTLEQDRSEKFGALDHQLKSSHEQTKALLETTQALRKALANNPARGQWGERMAEDVLRLCGLRENINYVKQKVMDNGVSRPDFSFILPGGRYLNMDVKFPLANYLRSLETSSEIEKAQRQKDFLRDVRSRIREITNRNYIDPQQNTLDYVLLFIPNEHVYAFIHEKDPALIDAAITSKVLLCAPLTLFGVLSVIRQAVDHFTLEQTSAEILSLMGVFKQHWDAFCDKMKILGKRIGETQKEYEVLLTTRRRQLEKPLNKIDELRATRLGQCAESPEPEELDAAG